eukprot:CAMPEP_0183410942 /NCGR_PEP_ID=MMETSP0370-20130417/19947_1 /TAXON_ID=268820 /ORGANISM="Peridinium aciculiferum, Strain PAER-2" /LENGTH=72 /DNA_ID=CAMNT_0025593849 /DNA_START=183 /DNA_END=401 /DNA_ORIENTATION=-
MWAARCADFRSSGPQEQAKDRADDELPHSTCASSDSQPQGWQPRGQSPVISGLGRASKDEMAVLTRLECTSN